MNVPWTTIGGPLVVLCLGGLVLSFVLPAVGGLLAFLGSIFELLLDVFTGGPVAWCGCLVRAILLVGCCGAAAIAGYSLSTCNTPDPVHFCSWFGF
jgi:hypothetical protein